MQRSADRRSPGSAPVSVPTPCLAPKVPDLLLPWAPGYLIPVPAAPTQCVFWCWLGTCYQPLLLLPRKFRRGNAGGRLSKLPATKDAGDQVVRERLRARGPSARSCALSLSLASLFFFGSSVTVLIYSMQGITWPKYGVPSGTSSDIASRVDRAKRGQDPGQALAHAPKPTSIHQINPLQPAPASDTRACRPTARAKDVPSPAARCRCRCRPESVVLPFHPDLP